MAHFNSLSIHLHTSNKKAVRCRVALFAEYNNKTLFSRHHYAPLESIPGKHSSPVPRGPKLHIFSVIFLPFFSRRVFDYRQCHFLRLQSLLHISGRGTAQKYITNIWRICDNAWSLNLIARERLAWGLFWRQEKQFVFHLRLRSREEN